MGGRWIWIWLHVGHNFMCKCVTACLFVEYEKIHTNRIRAVFWLWERWNVTKMQCPFNNGRLNWVGFRCLVRWECFSLLVALSSIALCSLPGGFWVLVPFLSLTNLVLLRPVGKPKLCPMSTGMWIPLVRGTQMWSWYATFLKMWY